MNRVEIRERLEEFSKGEWWVTGFGKGFMIIRSFVLNDGCTAFLYFREDGFCGFIQDLERNCLCSKVDKDYIEKHYYIYSNRQDDPDLFFKVMSWDAGAREINILEESFLEEELSEEARDDIMFKFQKFMDIVKS